MVWLVKFLSNWIDKQTHSFQKLHLQFTFCSNFIALSYDISANSQEIYPSLQFHWAKLELKSFPEPIVAARVIPYAVGEDSSVSISAAGVGQMWKWTNYKPSYQEGGYVM